jgi:hypothetical protein
MRLRMLMRKLLLFFLAFGITISSAFSEERPVKLSYRSHTSSGWFFSSRTPEADWKTRFSIEAVIPMYGQRKLTADYSASLDNSSDGRMAIQFAVDKTVNPYYSKPIGPFEGFLIVNKKGSQVELVSSLLDDEYQGTFIKDYRFLFLPLPEKEMAVGDSWEWDSDLHMPTPRQLGISGSFVRSLTIKGKSQIKSISPDGLVEVQTEINGKPFTSESGISSADLNLEGILTFDLSKGRFVKGDVTGELNMVVLFFALSTDITLSFNELE